MQTRLQAPQVKLDHRPPSAQAGQRIEPHLQFIEVQRRWVERRCRRLARPQGKPPGTQSAVGAEFNGMAEEALSEDCRGSRSWLTNRTAL